MTSDLLHTSSTERAWRCLFPVHAGERRTRADTPLRLGPPLCRCLWAHQRLYWWEPSSLPPSSVSSILPRGTTCTNLPPGAAPAPSFTLLVRAQEEYGLLIPLFFFLILVVLLRGERRVSPISLFHCYWPAKQNKLLFHSWKGRHTLKAGTNTWAPIRPVATFIFFFISYTNDFSFLALSFCD